jgi:hypothetical protein
VPGLLVLQGSNPIAACFERVAGVGVGGVNHANGNASSFESTFDSVDYFDWNAVVLLVAASRWNVEVDVGDGVALSFANVDGEAAKVCVTVERCLDNVELNRSNRSCHLRCKDRFAAIAATPWSAADCSKNGY